MSSVPVRVLVTGSRGKSGIVRLLHAGLEACGLQTWSRITGVVPRELRPGGVREIQRSAGAHVEEMRWWLRRIPASAEAVVLENSAISPDLQWLAARWLRPGLTILSNVLPDHQEDWGPGPAAAAAALVAGLPPGGAVLLPECLRSDQGLRQRIEKHRCETRFAAADDLEGPLHWSVNAGLALSAIEYLGLPVDRARDAVRNTGRDRYDFRIVRHRGAELALAFSVNDIASTRAAFRELGWSEKSTHLVYNHRKDRPGRLDSFRAWLAEGRWRKVSIIGDRPLRRPAGSRYLKRADAATLLGWLQPGERVFGCGNIAGHPLALY